MNVEEDRLMDQLIQIANAAFGGHLTILKFTTNWRVGFFTPAEREHIDSFAEGKTFAAAARNAIDRVRKTSECPPYKSKG